MVNESIWLWLGTGARLVNTVINLLIYYYFFFFNFTVAPRKELHSTCFFTIPVKIRSEVPNWNGVLTWIWDASCVPQVAFHAARPGRDQGWGWWRDNGHPCCRSSKRSPGAGDAPAGFCGTHRHISQFHSFQHDPKYIITKWQHTKSHTLHTYTVFLEGYIHQIPPFSLPAFKLGLLPCITINQQFFFHYKVIYTPRCCVAELLSPGHGLRTGRRFNPICLLRMNRKISTFETCTNSGTLILYRAHRSPNAVGFITRVRSLQLFQH